MPTERTTNTFRNEPIQKAASRHFPGAHCDRVSLMPDRATRTARVTYLGAVALIPVVGGAIIACNGVSPLGAPSTSSSDSGTAMSVSASGIVTATSGGFTYKVTEGVTVIDFGVELHNRSSQVSAIDVETQATFSDDHGHATTPDAMTITGIPPSGTFTLGGTTSPFNSGPNAPLDWVPQHMRVQIITNRTSPVQLVLPTVSGISVAGPRSLSLHGTVNNPYSGSAGEQWAGQHGTLYVVYWDGRGRFVGDNVVSLAALGLNNDAGVPPEASAQFTLAAPAPTGTLSATASVDPCTSLAGSGDKTCVALQSSG